MGRGKGGARAFHGHRRQRHQLLDFPVYSAKIGGDIYAAQEHGVVGKSLEAAQATTYQQGFQLIAGPLGETGHAGVAVLVR
ncbi:MAG: hypothetical protein ACKPKO_06920, partial [Candidatus Fonsibacter sp.]